LDNILAFCCQSRFLFLVALAGRCHAGVLLFGITLIVAPEFTRRFFGLLLFSSPKAWAGFGAPAVAYITLVHGVLGAVMVGWGVALLFVLLGPFRHRSKQGWLALVVSLLPGSFQTRPYRCGLAFGRTPRLT